MRLRVFFYLHRRLDYLEIVTVKLNGNENENENEVNGIVQYSYCRGRQLTRIVMFQWILVNVIVNGSVNVTALKNGVVSMLLFLTALNEIGIGFATYYGAGFAIGFLAGFAIGFLAGFSAGFLVGFWIDCEIDDRTLSNSSNHYGSVTNGHN